MRIIAREERSCSISHDYICHVSSLSQAQDVADMLKLLESGGYSLHEFSVNYVYDHADFHPQRSFLLAQELLNALKEEDFDIINSIIVIMTKDTCPVYATMYPASDTVRISYPQKA